jgi:tetratricopeptide (TPR) repeat protein
MPTHYELLGVSPEASAAEIRAAYAKVARERHPDRFTDPVEKERAAAFFTEATAAFNTLTNERARALYDQELLRPRSTTPADLGRDAFEEGWAKFQAHDYHEAVEHFRLAVAHDPSNGPYRVAYARALAKNPHWARRAVEAYEEALKHDPSNVMAHVELAGLLHQLGLNIRAQRVVEAAKRLAPTDPHVARAGELVGPSPPEAPPSAGGLFGRFTKRK